jgi:hypothetical protein
MRVKDINLLDVSKSLYLNRNYRVRCAEMKFGGIISAIPSLDIRLISPRCIFSAKAEAEIKIDHSR